MPHLDRITIYPVKSLTGVDVPEAVVLPSGALRDDRRFAVFDEDGGIVNGKRTPRVHDIVSSYDPQGRVLTMGLRGDGGASAFQVDTEGGALNAWLSEAFGVPVTVRESPESGFPDDTDAPGPTAIAAATLDAVAGWFGGLDADDCRGRFRANLEIGGTEAYWDDRLYGGPGRGVRFRVGGVVFEGVNPCQRCAVPMRSPVSGEAIPDFVRRFRTLREKTLPAWASASRFDHFYRLAVNTRLPAGATDSPAIVRVGDPVEIIPEAS